MKDHLYYINSVCTDKPCFPLSLLQCAGIKAVWIPDVVDGILLDRWPPNVRLPEAS